MILLLSKVYKYIAGCNKVRTTNYTVGIILDFAPLSNYFILLIFELWIITILLYFHIILFPCKSYNTYSISYSFVYYVIFSEYL